ncbi:MAG: TIR domain-containing protein [Candidatus Thiodiazotropha taylori]|nr:TIR domain-containing protein [Candidatus Thiodiazotropha endolucinida]MCW4228504.1 TIR domain-containing protein [Candidatus Thiodiazotropha taylori]
MIIDDDPAVARVVLRRIQEETNLVAIIAEDLRQACLFVDDDRLRLDAVIADINFRPETQNHDRDINDGLEFLAYANKKRSSLRMYIVSVYTGEAEKTKADKLGLNISGWYQKLNFGMKGQTVPPWKEIEKNMLGGASKQPDTDEYLYDIFLAHNSKDKKEVERLAEEIERHGFEPWLDKWHIPPGVLFQEEIERVLPKTRAIGICIGKSGVGAWERIEIRAAISQFISKNAPVIPIILSSCDEIDELPLMLREFSWVRFSDEIPLSESLQKLFLGIKSRDQSSNKRLWRQPD